MSEAVENASASWLAPEFEPGLVSVVVPTYNRADMVGETLASVLAQTHDRVEAVVVDDGSTDDTEKTVAAWRERFRSERNWELRFLRQEHGGGQRARNLGAKESRGEFINFLDDDDLFTADKLAEQVAVARDTRADIVYGPWIPFVRHEDGYEVERPHCARPIADGEHPFLAWLAGRSWYVMTAIISRAFLDRVGRWSLELRLAQDVAFVASCLRLEPRMAHCPRGALYRRRHKKSLSHESLAGYEDSLLKFAQMIEDFALEALPAEEARFALAQYLGRHSVSYRMKGSKRAADYYAQKAREYDSGYYPRNAGSSSALACRIGGFRLWLLKNRARDAFKNLRRRMGLGGGGGRRSGRRLAELPLSGTEGAGG